MGTRAAGLSHGENAELALERGDLKLCELAEMLGTSPSYLSIVKNSPWGQRRLRILAMAESGGASPHRTT